MKRYLLLFLLSFAFYNIHAQSWCLPGASWHYSYFGMGGMGYVTYTVTSDTIVDNRLCHILSGKSYNAAYNYGSYGYRYDTSSSGPIYTYDNNDTVYFYKYINGWKASYFWNAHVGDTLKSLSYSGYNLPDTLGYAIVYQADTVILNSISLRRYRFQFIDTCPGHYVFGGEVIERMGITNNSISPFWQCISDYDSYHLCSYEDDSFALYPPGRNCLTLPTGIHETASIKWSAHPNPAQTEVICSIEDYQEGTTISVIDPMGNYIKILQADKNDTKIVTADLADGMYFIKVSYPDLRSGIKKLLILH